jgi:hypothetical protein
MKFIFAFLFSAVFIPGDAAPPTELNVDLDCLVWTLNEAHPDLYWDTSREEFENEIAAVRARLTCPMDSRQFYLEIAPLVALARDGHTCVVPLKEEFKAFKEDGGAVFPLILEWRGENIYVAGHCGSENGIPCGARLRAVNGVPLDELVDRLLPYVHGDRVPHRKRMLLERFDLLLWTVYEWSGQFEISYSLPGSEEIVSAKVDGYIANPDQREKPGSKPPYWYESWPDEQIGMMIFEDFVKEDTIRGFVEYAAERIEAEGVTDLIIDLRGNLGGISSSINWLLMYLFDGGPTNLFGYLEIKLSSVGREELLKAATDEKSKWILQRFIDRRNSFHFSAGNPVDRPEGYPRFQGRIYTLIDTGSYSGAVDLAAIIKDHKKGILVGEETGGLATGFGFYHSFRLPYTQLEIHVSTARNIRPSNTDDGHGVIPDHLVTPTAADLETGNDTVVEFTKDLIRKTKEPTQ